MRQIPHTKAMKIISAFRHIIEGHFTLLKAFLHSEYYLQPSCVKWAPLASEVSHEF